MSIAYREIIRMGGLRVNAIKGVTSAALETAYTTSPLTTTEVVSADFPLSTIKDSLVSVIGRLVRSYASVPNHPFRSVNLSQTASIANKAQIPAVNSAGKSIVGVYGAIRDATSGEVLTEQPVQIINTIVANTDDFLTCEYHYHKIVSDRLYHTRTNAVIDVCTFSASDELTAMDANGDAPIPDALLDAAWCGLVAALVRDDEFAAQASLCGNYFEGVISAMTSGAQSFTPAPVLVASQQPAVS